MLLAVGAVLEPPSIVHVDSVTGLPASLEFNKAVRRLRGRYALACVAIDDLKTFREEQGVQTTNRMLRLVANALTQIQGGGRVFYLLRDHEFVVLFRRQSAATAMRHVDAVRREVQSASLDVRVPRQQAKTAGKTPGRVVRTVAATISAGIADTPGPGADPHAVLQEAERALLQAQVGGMNRIVVPPRSPSDAPAIRSAKAHWTTRYAVATTWMPAGLRRGLLRLVLRLG